MAPRPAGRGAPKRKVNPLHRARVTEVDRMDVAIRNAREMALLPYANSGRG